MRPDVLHHIKQHGVAPHVVEQLLGHSLGGVMAVYNRSQYLPEKLDALNQWMEQLNILSEKEIIYY